MGDSHSFVIIGYYLFQIVIKKINPWICCTVVLQINQVVCIAIVLFQLSRMYTVQRITQSLKWPIKPNTIHH